MAAARAGRGRAAARRRSRAPGPGRRSRLALFVVQDVAAAWSILAGAGLGYRGAFRSLCELQVGDGEALARVALPEPFAAEAEHYGMHPGLLDSALQAVAVVLDWEEAAYLPFAVEQDRLFATGSRQAWAHLRRRPASAAAEVETVDVRLAADDGRRCWPRSWAAGSSGAGGRRRRKTSTARVARH